MLASWFNSKNYGLCCGPIHVACTGQFFLFLLLLLLYHSGNLQKYSRKLLHFRHYFEVSLFEAQNNCAGAFLQEGSVFENFRLLRWRRSFGRPCCPCCATILVCDLEITWKKVVKLSLASNKANRGIIRAKNWERSRREHHHREKIRISIHYRSTYIHDRYAAASRETVARQ